MIRKLLNPDAYSKNIFKPLYFAAGCCNSVNGVVKEYSYSAGEEFEGFLYTDKDGVQQTVSFTASDDIIELKKLYQAAIRDINYVTHTEDYGYKGNGVDVILLGNNIVVRLAGELVIDKFIVDGANVNPVVKTNITAADARQFELDYDTDPGLLSKDGAAGTQVGTTDGWAAGVPSAVQAALITALDTQTAGYDNVVVVDDGAGYIITINTFEADLKLDGAIGTWVTSYPAFIN